MTKKLVCGQCEMGNHDRCNSVLCECGCPGFSIPLPPDERKDKPSIVAVVEARIAGPNYVATGPTYGEFIYTPPYPDGKFPISLTMSFAANATIYHNPNPTPTPAGTIVAYYELKEVRELKTITETKETILDLAKYITEPI